MEQIPTISYLRKAQNKFLTTVFDEDTIKRTSTGKEVSEGITSRPLIGHSYTEVSKEKKIHSRWENLKYAEADNILSFDELSEKYKYIPKELTTFNKFLNSLRKLCIVLYIPFLKGYSIGYFENQKKEEDNKFREISMKIFIEGGIPYGDNCDIDRDLFNDKHILKEKCHEN